MFSNVWRMLLILALCTPIALFWHQPPQAVKADEAAWYVHVVESNEGEAYGFSGTSLATDPLTGRPVVAYTDSSTHYAVKLARWNGTSWEIETIDAGDKPSLAFDAAGGLYVAYRAYGADVLKLARWNGSTWEIEAVDSAGLYISLAVDRAGNPGIAYSHGGLVRYAYWGGSWEIQDISREPELGDGREVSLAFDAEGRPNIVSAGRPVEYARWDGSAWAVQSLPDDLAMARNRHVALSFDGQGRPWVAYNDEGVLKASYWTSGDWLAATVGAQSMNTSTMSSLAVAPDGRMTIAYNGEGGLRYGTWDGGSWQTQQVDGGDIGYYPSLAHDGSGNPVISYTGHLAFRVASLSPMSSPGQPQNLSPVHGSTGINLSPVLRASSFNGAAGREHAASRWRITYEAGAEMKQAFDSSRDTANLTELPVPPGKLTYALRYYWSVQYQDSAGNWSIPSSPTSFRTGNYVQPGAAFGVDPPAVAPGESVTFQDLSSGYISSWRWDLGDGTIVSWTPHSRPDDGKLTQAYAYEGRYDISLKVETLAGEDAATREDGVIVGDVMALAELSPGGAILETEDGALAISFPPGFVAGPVSAWVLQEPVPASLPAGYRAASTSFTLYLVDASGLAIQSPSAEAVVTLRYTEGDLLAAKGNADALALARYDEAGDTWEIVSATANAADKTFVTRTSGPARWLVVAKASTSPTWAWGVAGVAAVSIGAVVYRSRHGRRHA